MNPPEIMMLLQSYRPGSADEADPLFESALKEAARDPALTAWLREEQEFDAAMVRTLREIPVDLELKARILEQPTAP